MPNMKEDYRDGPDYTTDHSGEGAANARALAEQIARSRTTPWGSSGKKERKARSERRADKVARDGGRWHYPNYVGAPKPFWVSEEEDARHDAANAEMYKRIAVKDLAARVKQGDAIREAYRARKAARPKLVQAVGLLSVGAGLFRSNKGGAK